MLKTCVILFALLIHAFSSFSQKYEKEFETVFAWEVKQIDEFIERYNFDNKTLIIKYTQDEQKLRQLNRERLLKSLFNVESKNWNLTDITNFIKQVNDTSHAVYLNFLDSDWFAEVNCTVTWKGKPEKATLILKVQKEPNQASKWVVAGVKAKFLQLTKPSDSTSSLNPLSHALDFMNIDLVSSDKQNLPNYFPRLFDYDEMSVFINEIINRRLVINSANSISYHFLQVDGWIFKVQQFERESRNSGWLISKLLRVTAEEKTKYRAALLNKIDFKIATHEKL